MSKLSLKKSKPTTTSTPILRGLLEKPRVELKSSNPDVPTSSGAAGVSTAAPRATIPKATQGVLSVNSTSSASGLNPKNTWRISSVTSTVRSTPYYGDLNQSRRGESKEKITAQTLAQYLIQHGIYEPEDFVIHATRRDGYGGFQNARAQEIYFALATRANANFTQVLARQIKFARSYTPDTPYEKRIKIWQPHEHLTKEEIAMGENYVEDYKKVLQHHGINRRVLEKWFKTLALDNGKRCTIYMCGRANSGKTTLIELLSAFYEPWEIGRAQPQSSQSNFFLQDLAEKRLFHADEILATPLNIDTLKLLLEGSEDLATDIKYGEKVRIKRRPVLIGTNDPLWINFSTAAEPILARCEYLGCTRSLPKLKYIRPKNKNILKFVLKRIFAETFPNGYELFKSTEEINETIDSAIHTMNEQGTMEQFLSNFQ